MNQCCFLGHPKSFCNNIGPSQNLPRPTRGAAYRGYSGGPARSVIANQPGHKRVDGQSRSARRPLPSRAGAIPHGRGAAGPFARMSPGSKTRLDQIKLPIGNLKMAAVMYPHPPRHLSPSARQWWETTVRNVSARQWIVVAATRDMSAGGRRKNQGPPAPAARVPSSVAEME